MASTHLQREVYSQPDDWQRAAERAPHEAHLLPAPGDAVAVVGCGTSYFMAQAYAELREAAGQGRTDAFCASEHHLERGYDHVLIICRSGTTTEVLAVLDTLHELGTAHTALVATAGTPVAERAAGTILLSEFDEQSVVQSRFATSTLALLRASLGASLDQAIADAHAVLAEPEEQAIGHLLDITQVTFLGTGWTVGLAHEAALKIRESCQFWAESYPAMEYRHGPISICAPGRATWMFGMPPRGLSDEVTRTGGHFEHRELDPMAELVRLHRLCLGLVDRAGLDPDNPRNLTRSIVLDA